MSTTLGLFNIKDDLHFVDPSGDVLCLGADPFFWEEGSRFNNGMTFFGAHLHIQK